MSTWPPVYQGARTDASTATPNAHAADHTTLDAADKTLAARVDDIQFAVTVGLTTGEFKVSDYASPEACLQAASDVLATGGLILLRAGTYSFVSAGVTLGDYVSLAGEGDSTVIEWTDGANVDAYLLTTGLFSQVSNVRCLGHSTYACPLPVANNGGSSNTYTTTGTNTAGKGIKVAYARARLNNVHIEGMASHGLRLEGANSTPLSIQATNVKVLGCGGTGVHLYSHATDGEWVNLWVGSCSTGLRAEANNGESAFRNAHVWGCQNNGVEFAATDSRFHGQVETNGGTGILVSANGCSIESGTSVWGNGRSAQASGIEFASASNCSLGNVEVRDNNGTAILLSGTTRGVRGFGIQVNDRLAAFQSSGAAQTYSDGAGTAASHTFTTAAAPFDPVINKSIVIAGAGTAGATLTTTITAVNPGVSVTLADPIVTSVSGATFRFAAVTYGIRETDTATGNSFVGCNIPTAEVITARTSLSSGSLELDWTTAPGLRTLLSVPAYTRSTFSDADVTISASQQYMAQIGTLTAARVVTLPAVSAVPAGWPVEVVDESGTCSVSNTLTVTAPGSDRIRNGSSVTATYVISSAGGSIRLRANGTSRWELLSTNIAQDLSSYATTSALTTEASTRASADTTNASAITSEAATARAAESANAAAIAAKMQGLTRTSVKTSGYTAVSGDLVPCDSTSGGFTVTLPAAATGAIVAVKHIIQGSTNAITVACAGSDVFNKTSGATTLSLALLAQGVVLVGASGIWTIVADDLALAQLDARYALLTGATMSGALIVLEGSTAEAWGASLNTDTNRRVRVFTDGKVQAVGDDSAVPSLSFTDAQWFINHTRPGASSFGVGMQIRSSASSVVTWPLLIEDHSGLFIMIVKDAGGVLVGDAIEAVNGSVTVTQRMGFKFRNSFGTGALATTIDPLCLTLGNVWDRWTGDTMPANNQYGLHLQPEGYGFACTITSGTRTITVTSGLADATVIPTGASISSLFTGLSAAIPAGATVASTTTTTITWDTGHAVAATNYTGNCTIFTGALQVRARQGIQIHGDNGSGTTAYGNVLFSQGLYLQGKGNSVFLDPNSAGFGIHADTSNNLLPRSNGVGNIGAAGARFATANLQTLNVGTGIVNGGVNGGVNVGQSAGYFGTGYIQTIDGTQLTAPDGSQRRFVDIAVTGTVVATAARNIGMFPTTIAG